MNRKQIRLQLSRATTIVALAFISTGLFAQAKFKSAASNVVITGTSTMHDWEEKANAVNVTAEFHIANNVIQGLNGGNVQIDVKAIKSPKGSLMDNRTYDALQADKHPSISFQVTKVVSVQQANGTTLINVLGNLTIAGNTQSTDLQLTCVYTSNGNVHIKGAKKLKMSGYGIKPPSFMLGALKVADDVSIAIDVTMIKA
ncbi:MAG: YceI family protein [Bacteroidota bacterium]|nr:YceI family protein [Bacteroidota bacterium]